MDTQECFALASSEYGLLVKLHLYWDGGRNDHSIFLRLNSDVYWLDLGKLFNFRILLVWDNESVNILRWFFSLMVANFNLYFFSEVLIQKRILVNRFIRPQTESKVIVSPHFLRNAPRLMPSGDTDHVQLGLNDAANRLES